MTRKVFVVSDGGHDYSDAERFGKIVFCTDLPIRRDDVHQMYRELGSCLAEADRKDYLLVSSLTSMCMVAAGFLADAFGELHLLIYHDGKYISKDLYYSEVGAMEVANNDGS